MTITFVGGGNMASALIGGLLKQGWHAASFTVVEILPQARDALARQFNVTAVDALGESLDPQETILLAVKPQNLREVARSLRAQLRGQLVISIAAGIRTTDLSKWLGGHQRICRVMPNTPALVSAGVSALYAMPAVSTADRQHAQAILSAVGGTLWLEREELMDVATAVSGSGPAYVFYFMEGVMEAAQSLGLSAEQARQLTLETFYGAACLARQSDEPPSRLRERVTSKGGTTERALQVLEAEAVKMAVVSAVRHAAERSRQLGDELGALS